MIGEIITVTNKDVIMAVQGMQRIGNLQLEAQTAYWLGRNFKHLQTIANKLDAERGEIIKKHGTKDEKTGMINIPPTIGEGEDQKPNPALEAVNKAINDLLDQEVEVTINKVGLQGFTSIALNDISALDFMIKEDVVGNLVKLQR